jgi:hypothetical protein
MGPRGLMAVKRGRPRGTASTPEQDLAIIDAVMQAWSPRDLQTMLRRSFRSNDPTRNVFAIASQSLTSHRLNRSVSRLRAAFNEAWERQYPHEPKPSVERRRACIRMHLRMQGAKLPRRWREPVFVSSGDRDANPNTPRLIWAENKS